MKNDLRWARFLISLKDPEGSEVDKVQGNNLTGAVSFPDFQIPSNPKYVKMFINNHFFSEKKTTWNFRLWGRGKVKRATCSAQGQHTCGYLKPSKG